VPAPPKARRPRFGASMTGASRLTQWPTTRLRGGPFCCPGTGSVAISLRDALPNANVVPGAFVFLRPTLPTKQPISKAMGVPTPHRASNFCWAATRIDGATAVEPDTPVRCKAIPFAPEWGTCGEQIRDSAAQNHKMFSVWHYVYQLI
jgi:hypothetical protein